MYEERDGERETISGPVRRGSRPAEEDAQHARATRVPHARNTYTYTYIYTCMCVCVCECVYEERDGERETISGPVLRESRPAEEYVQQVRATRVPLAARVATPCVELTQVTFRYVRSTYIRMCVSKYRARDREGDSDSPLTLILSCSESPGLG